MFLFLLNIKWLTEILLWSSNKGGKDLLDGLFSVETVSSKWLPVSLTEDRQSLYKDKKKQMCYETNQANDSHT